MNPESYTNIWEIGSDQSIIHPLTCQGFGPSEITLLTCGNSGRPGHERDAGGGRRGRRGHCGDGRDRVGCCGSFCRCHFRRLVVSVVVSFSGGEASGSCFHGGEQDFVLFRGWRFGWRAFGLRYPGRAATLLSAAPPLAMNRWWPLHFRFPHLLPMSWTCEMERTHKPLLNKRQHPFSRDSRYFYPKCVVDIGMSTMTGIR